MKVLEVDSPLICFSVSHKYSDTWWEQERYYGHSFRVAEGRLEVFKYAKSEEGDLLEIAVVTIAPGYWACIKPLLPTENRNG